MIATRSSLQTAILSICVSAWLVCTVFLLIAARLVPRDIQALRSQMRQRAERAKAKLDGAAIDDR